MINKSAVAVRRVQYLRKKIGVEGFHPETQRKALWIRGGEFLKRNKQLQTLLTQFGYEHRKLDGQFTKIQKNADELSRLLNNMTSSKGKKQEK